MTVKLSNKVSITNRKQAWEIVGGLSDPSKMPGFSYSLPATSCKTGSKLHKIEGSVCSKCYARKGMYVFPNVKKALARRLKSIYRKGWVEAMAFLLLNQKTSDCFRWHDSGDLQSITHFKRIVKVCEMTPTIKHWLPTHETKIVKKAIKQGVVIPKNLVIRFSSCMINAPVRLKDVEKFNASSTYVGEMDEKRKKIERPCTAPKRKGECGNCRLCWNKAIKAVSYKLH